MSNNENRNVRVLVLDSIDMLDNIVSVSAAV